MNEKVTLSFKPKEVTKRLLSTLTKRAQDVITSRYGLGSKSQRLTLDAIGKKYNITRERVRQIENHSLASIRKSKSYKETEEVFAELKAIVVEMGSLVSEKDLLSYLSKDVSNQNHLHFLLVIGDDDTTGQGAVVWVSCHETDGKLGSEFIQVGGLHTVVDTGQGTLCYQIGIDIQGLHGDTVSLLLFLLTSTASDTGQDLVKTDIFLGTISLHHLHTNRTTHSGICFVSRYETCVCSNFTIL